MTLEAIAYSSSAVGLPTESELERLLDDARARNLRTGVTGVLLYHDGSFFQYFEGPPAGVAEVYGRILGSRRHRGVIELMRMPLARRCFADWQMGFVRVPASAMLQLTNARWRASAARACAELAPTLPAGLSLLLQFWADQRGPALAPAR